MKNNPAQNNPNPPCFVLLFLRPVQRWNDDLIDVLGCSNNSHMTLIYILSCGFNEFHEEGLSSCHKVSNYKADLNQVYSITSKIHNFISRAPIWVIFEALESARQALSPQIFSCSNSWFWPKSRWVQNPMLGFQAHKWLLWHFALQTPNPRAWNTSQATKNQ